jgi:uncharacterized protein (DUF4415 family)
MTDEKTEFLQAEFQATAAPAAPPQERVAVALDLDADLLEWLKTQPTDWQREVNNLVRFFMETSQGRELQYGPDAWEPGEPPEPRAPTIA